MLGRRSLIAKWHVVDCRSDKCRSIWHDRIQNNRAGWAERRQWRWLSPSFLAFGGATWSSKSTTNRRGKATISTFHQLDRRSHHEFAPTNRCAQHVCLCVDVCFIFQQCPNSIGSLSFFGRECRKLLFLSVRRGGEHTIYLGSAHLNSFWSQSLALTDRLFTWLPKIFIRLVADTAPPSLG